MNVKVIFFLFAFVGILLTACDDDDKDPENNLVEEAFKKMYPDAKDKDWDRDGIYYVVDFKNHGKDTKAWFTGNGTWYQTRTHISRSDVPSYILDVLDDSVYGDYRIEEVYHFERPSNNDYYYFELESDDRDVHVTIDMDGDLTIV